MLKNHEWKYMENNRSYNLIRIDGKTRYDIRPKEIVAEPDRNQTFLVPPTIEDEKLDHKSCVWW